MIATQEQTSLATPIPLRNHVIICGLGNLGLRIHLQLDMLGIPAVVIDRTPEVPFVHRLAAGPDHLVQMDATQPEALEAAGIATARALITTYDDDLVNLEVTLTAQRRRPDLPVVMRFFNIDLAASIRQAMPNVTLLSLSAVAAPAFVLAAMDPHARAALSIDDEALGIDEIPVAYAHSSTLAHVATGSALALAWQGAGAEAEPLPPPTQLITNGDRLTVIGPEPELQALAARLGQHREPRRTRRTGRGGRMGAGVGSVLRNLDRALYYTLAALALVILLSVGLFALSKHLSLLDALFFVFTVISSTGVGGADVQQDPDWIKIYIILLMIMGTAVLTILYAFVTNYIVSVKLSGLLGQRPVTMENHIVLCGLGTVGYRVAEGLVARGEHIAVLESSETNRFLPLMRTHREQVQLVIADARLRDSLSLMNVTAARCIITATNDDMANIQAALNARQLNPGIRVVFRMFDQSAAQRVAETFGFQVALSASALAAPTFVAAACGQAVVQDFAFGTRRVEVARLTVPPASPATGQPLGQLLAGLPVQVLYHRAPAAPPTYRPDPATLLGLSDALVVLAPAEVVRQLIHCLAPHAA